MNKALFFGGCYGLVVAGLGILVVVVVVVVVVVPIDFFVASLLALFPAK